MHVDIFLLHRLCGRVPFKSDSAGKLEELIMQGELNFREIEWINVSQPGMNNSIHSITLKFNAGKVGYLQYHEKSSLHTF